MGKTLVTPNGKSVVTVPDNQVAHLESQGFTDQNASGGKDRKASKKPKDTAKTKAISEVEAGEDRTR